MVRDRASLARLVEDGHIENTYRLQLMNTTEQMQRYRVGVAGWPQAHVVGVSEVELGPAQARWVPLAVRLPPEEVQQRGPGVHEVTFLVERITEPGQAPAAVAEGSTFVIPR